MVCSLLALLSYHFGVLFSILAVTSLLCPNKNCPPARPGRRKGPNARETEPKQNNYPKLLILTINTYNIRLKVSGGVYWWQEIQMKGVAVRIILDMDQKTITVPSAVAKYVR